MLSLLFPHRLDDDDETKIPDPPFDTSESDDLESHVRHERIRFSIVFALLRNGRRVMRRMDHRLFRIELAIYTLVIAVVGALYGLDDALAHAFGG